MFCAIPPPPVFINVPVMHNLQQSQYLKLASLSLPNYVHEIETDNLYQIQISKPSGGFSSYKLMLVRDRRNPLLINLVVESHIDAFRKVFQFWEMNIDLQHINWQHNKSTNMLILNVPKKLHNFVNDFIYVLPSNITKITKPEMHYESKTSSRPKRIVSNASHGREPIILRKSRSLEPSSDAKCETRKAQEIRKLDTHLNCSPNETKSKSCTAIKMGGRVTPEEGNDQLDVEKKGSERTSPFEQRLMGADKSYQNTELSEHQRAILQKSLYALLGGALLLQSQKSANVRQTAEDIGSCVAEGDQDSINLETESVNSEDCDLKVDDGISLLRKHPSLEEVEDEEFVPFRQK